MKCFITINSTNQNITQCQIGIEVDIDDHAEKKEIDLSIDKVAETLKAAMNRTINTKPLAKTSEPAPEPAQLPAPAVTSSQCPTAASEKQIKYLTFLTSKCGSSLSKWCKEQGVKKDEITKADAMKWIPELEFKAEGTGF